MKSSDLKKAGLKVTIPRMKILKFLEESRVRHHSAESIYMALSNDGEEIGLATVYRVLTQFENKGLVVRHRFEGDNQVSNQSVFELNVKGHHDHIVCSSCHKVEEFYDDVIESRQKEIAAARGYEFTGHSLTLYGICPACQKSQSK